MRTRLLALLVLIVVLPLALVAQPAQQARAALLPAMNRTWARTDYPIQQNQAVRTWMWGPTARYEKTEPYVEAPSGQRFVAYFDKSRMEDNSYNTTSAPWDVTNGLLVVELISGRMQVGDAAFEQHLPADVNVAGDADDADGPTYASFGGLLNAAPLADNALITQRLDRNGTVTNDSTLSGRGVRATYLVERPGLTHRIAAPFWNFMNSSGVVFENGFVNALLFQDPFYATGLPITEAYWARVKVGGNYKDVLMQCFERRCLTYTPDNAPEWQVEMGNVGMHYYTWRYCGEEGEIVFSPNLGDLPEWTSTDGYIHHYYDGARSAYVIEDTAPLPTSDDASGSFVWWPATEVLPKDYSLTVDIITLTDDTTDQSSASLMYRAEIVDNAVSENGLTEIFTNGLALSLFEGTTGISRLTDPDEIPVFNTGFGAVNRLKVIVRGASVKVYVNATFVHAFNLDPRSDLLANGFGFAVYRFYPGDTDTRFGFQNLYIRELKDTGC
jgi:hypothetical protein